jgi:hypothetical protein
MRHAAVALPALAVLALFGCAARSASPQPPLSKATARYVAYLENPARAAWQKPDAVVGALRLKGGEQVTDLGRMCPSATNVAWFSRRNADHQPNADRACWRVGCVVSGRGAKERTCDRRRQSSRRCSCSGAR